MSTNDDPYVGLFQELEQPFSHERLDSYFQASGSERDALINYFWNMQLCEALYPSLDALEVALRNAIHQAATARYGTEYWFDQPNVLRFRQPDAVQTARDELQRNNAPQNAGRIIAELNFGFWTTILSGPYDQHFWKTNNYRLLRQVVPRMPYRERTRVNVHARINALRGLRNRVFHYEPVWNRLTLANDHTHLVEAIGWISPELGKTITRFDRFANVLQHGRPDVERKLNAMLRRRAPRGRQG